MGENWMGDGIGDMGLRKNKDNLPRHGHVKIT